MIINSLLCPETRADETLTLCLQCSHDQKNEFLSALDEIEQDIAALRWKERELRKTEYDDLWLARSRSEEPLDAEVRERGKKDAAGLLRILKTIKDTRYRLRQSVYNGIERLKERYRESEMCCEAHSYRKCMQARWAEASGVLQNLSDTLDEVYAHEQIMLDKVRRSIGGRDGTYEEEILEKSDQHDDYYWRIESEKEPERYHEDESVMNDLLALKRFFLLSYPGDDCCYSVDHS